MAGMNDSRPVSALTIAGSDSSGGAGIQADLKTFTVLGVFGMSAITAITAQNTLGVKEALELDPKLIARQIDVVATDSSLNADASPATRTWTILDQSSNLIANPGYATPSMNSTWSSRARRFV